MYCITASHRLKGGEAHRARLRRRRRHQHTQVLRDRVGRGGFLCRYEIVVCRSRDSFEYFIYLVEGICTLHSL